MDLKKYNLNKRQLEAITKMTNENIKFTYKNYCEYFNVSKSTCRRDLDDLVMKKLIKKGLNNMTNIFYVENEGYH